MVKIKIKTHHSQPPSPVRQFDWDAVEDNYEPGRPIGRGPTEQARFSQEGNER